MLPSDPQLLWTCSLPNPTEILNKLGMWIFLKEGGGWLRMLVIDIHTTVLMCVYTHTHRYTHTHTGTHTHRYTHRYTHTHTQVHTQVHTHRYTHTHTGKHTHRYTHTHTQVHTLRVQVNVHLLVLMVKPSFTCFLGFIRRHFPACVLEYSP
jgi:hypothetical protein